MDLRVYLFDACRIMSHMDPKCNRIHEQVNLCSHVLLDLPHALRHHLHLKVLQKHLINQPEVDDAIHDEVFQLEHVSDLPQLIGLRLTRGLFFNYFIKHHVVLERNQLVFGHGLGVNLLDLVMGQHAVDNRLGLLVELERILVLVNLRLEVRNYFL